MNNNHRKPLQGTQLEYFDVREAVEQIQPGAYAKLPYTSKVLATPWRLTRCMAGVSSFYCRKSKAKSTNQANSQKKNVRLWNEPRSIRPD